jgi:solute carrier family 25 S-adenosylmethionine transporter 26
MLILYYKLGMYQSMNKAISGTISKDGLVGLYKGYGITIVREIPFSFIQFPIYEKLKIGTIYLSIYLTD